MKRFIVGITGATGAIYGIRLVEELLHRDFQVYLTVTHAGEMVLGQELGIELRGKSSGEKEAAFVRFLLASMQRRRAKNCELAVPQVIGDLTDELVESRLKHALHYTPIEAIGANIASGSFLTEGMAVVPCSMSTLAGIAQGRSMNALERAADVMQKEGRPLLLAPREMPFNAIHLENMLKLSRLGVSIVPPMPGFYHNPQTIDDLIDFVVGKILDRLKIPHGLFTRWQGME